jgi:alpha-amylase
MWVGFLVPMLLAGCADDTLDPVPTPPTVPLIAVLVAPDGATLAVSDSLQMSAAVIVPRNWGTISVAWSTTDTTVATISTTGMVDARSPGITGVVAVLTNSRPSVASGSATLHVQ